MSQRQLDIDSIAMDLPALAARFTKLLARHGGSDLPRGMAGVLAGLLEGPAHIGRLAQREAVSQPAVTRMVERLEREGLVRRERDEHDRRLVLVTITDDGRDAIERRQAHYRASLRASLDRLSDDEIREIAAGSRALAALNADLSGALNPSSGPHA